MIIKFWERIIKEPEHEIKEINSKLQSNLPSTKYNYIKEQVSKNQKLTIQQLSTKKTHKIANLRMVKEYQKSKPKTCQ